MISDDLGMKLENVGIDMLGKARKISITKDETTIVEGHGEKSEIEARVAQIRSQIEDTTSDYDKEKLQERLAKLAGGVAVIRVGGASEIEVKERKDRVEDALNATRAAVQEGVVVGGGVALVRAVEEARRPDRRQLRPDRGHRDRPQGAPVAAAADRRERRRRRLRRRRARSSSSNDPAFGFNAQTEEYGDMFKFGVIDPAKVVRTALQDAASVAGLLITTEAMIADKPEPKGQAGGGMPRRHGRHGRHDVI